jgi:shikimate kinase
MAATTIFLIGFMGSGKTTFGKKLAAKLKYRFIDLDEELCKKYNTPDIKTLIEQKGMDFFREAENLTLKKLNAEQAVVSTGGGTPCYFDAIDWMKRRGVVVFLQVDEGVIFSRLKTTELDERPLLKGLDDEGLKSFISSKLAERLPYYEQAHIVFNPVKEKMEGLVERIIT